MRYAKVKVVNTDRMRGSRSKDIPVLDYDGKMLVIQDGAIGELSEYVISSLNDAIHEDTVFVSDGPGQPNRKEFRQAPRVNVTMLGEWYEKGPKKVEEIPKVVEATPDETPPEPVTTVPEGIIFNQPEETA